MPTAGRIDLYGRVASLLEVGTGFHPELTGRENVFLNGAILGMRRREVARRFDEIVAFAGVERFLETPVKRYSSGMYVRLAFAVAAHLDAEILLIDEVLAVGDAEFQRRSLGKMGEVAADGRTVLLVSHNLSVVASLATRCVVLDGGTVSFVGETTEAVNRYAALSKSYATSHSFRGAQRLPDLPPNPSLTLVAGRLERELEIFGASEEIVVLLQIHATEDVTGHRLRLTIRRTNNEPVGTTFTAPLREVAAGETVTYRVVLTGVRLSAGAYFFAISVGMGDDVTGHRLSDCVLEVLPFEVAPPVHKGATGSWSYMWGPSRWPAAAAETVDHDVSLIGESNRRQDC
jgi:lipopolysaccharide transport system ATP-binding protein